MEMTETRAEGTAPQAQRRMTAEDYERQRQHIKTIYGDSTAEAGAQRDQALAALYHRSGWTQEELAKAEGCKQQNIARRLLFGRFLGFTPDRSNPKNLTEWRFRSYWERTEKGSGNERIRFQAVLRLMEEETILRKPTAPKFEIGAAIMAEFADDKSVPHLCRDRLSRVPALDERSHEHQDAGVEAVGHRRGDVCDVLGQR